MFGSSGPPPVPSVSAEIAAGDSIKLISLARERNVDPSCVFRWAHKGLPGANGRVNLESAKIGRAWHTSRAAIARFFAALPQSASSNTSGFPSLLRPRAELKRQSDDERAAAILKSKGF